MRAHRLGEALVAPAQNSTEIRAIERAKTEACHALALSQRASLPQVALSIVLKYWLIQAVEDSIAPRQILRKRMHASELEHRTRARVEVAKSLYQATSFDANFLSRLASSVDVKLPDWRLSPRGQAWWISRIAQLAYEKLLSESIAPELQVAAEPLGGREMAEALDGRMIHAIVCGELVGFTNELFPLIVDARSVFSQCGITVIGVHGEWLKGTSACRAIIYDHGRDTLIETELTECLPFRSVHFLYLGDQRERELHEKLSHQLFETIQLNSYSAAVDVDSKWKTAQILTAAGVPTPPTLLIPSDMNGDALTEHLATFCREASVKRLVVQPDRGTEGRGVAVFIPSTSGHLDPAGVAHVQALQSQGDVIARMAIDGLRYREGDGSYSADLRVNVAFDGKCYRAESGYLQVAGNFDAFASSVSRGGRIVALSAGAWEGLGLSGVAIEPTLSVACRAAEALSRGSDERLALVGVDLKLEKVAGELHAWVLDLNPRPAGLSYCELFDSGEPGVSTGVWSGPSSAVSSHRIRRVGDERA
jgi:hypothetical protein